MSWVAAAIGGSALLGAYSSSQASKAQKAGLDAAAQAQMMNFERGIELQRPYRDIGTQGLNQLAYLLGIGSPNAMAEEEAYKRLYDKYNEDHIRRYGVSIDRSTDQAQAMTWMDQMRQQARQEAAASPQGTTDAGFGSLMRDFSASDFEQDPGYAFRLSEGMKALDRSAAARGGLQSGAALKAAARYGQDMASQEYQNAFNRYQVNRQNKLQPLMYLTGVGQTASGGQAAAAGQLGQGLAGTYGAMGDVNAAGQMGAANAIAGGLGQYLNYQQGQNYLQALRRPSTYGYSTSYGE